MSSSYPSILQNSTAAPQGDTRPIPLSRSERNSIRREARDINIYDLGVNSNLRAIFGNHSILLAFIPFVRAHRKSNLEAGHYFDIDEAKYEKLKELVSRLRADEAGDQTYFSENEYSDDEDLQSLGEDWEDEQDDAVPVTGSSGARGDDELSDSDSVRGKVSWFEN